MTKTPTVLPQPSLRALGVYAEAYQALMRYHTALTKGITGEALIKLGNEHRRLHDIAEAKANSITYTQHELK